MPQPYTIFDESTGAILRTGNAPDLASADLQVRDGEDILYEGSNPATQRVNVASRSLEARPAFPGQIDKTSVIADMADFARITPVPVGTRGNITGANGQAMNYTILDGRTDLTFERAGTYQIRLTHPEYQAATFTIEATEP